MTTTIHLLLGALACLAFVLLARKAGSRRETLIYVVGLIVAASIYVGFAAIGGAPLSWIALESGGLLLFSVIALLGLKVRVQFLVLGWAVHPAWDVCLHQVMKVGFVPEWYPTACLAFDLILAAYIGISVRGGRHLGPSVKDIFSSIHRHNSWADPESVSGRGSTLPRTAEVRRSLGTLLESVDARSLLDAACGDFNWMRQVGLENIQYTGTDVVPELITRNRQLYENQNRSFVLLDITSDPLPQVDVILCRDCFIHLSSSHIREAIANFKRSNSVFLLATTHTSIRENREIRTGGWRSVNLELPPFNFMPPIKLIIEDAESGKSLGLWNLEQLPGDPRPA